MSTLIRRTLIATLVPTVGDSTVQGTDNILPTINLSNPTSDSEYPEGFVLAISAEAFDVDGDIQQVEFLVDGLVAHVVLQPPYNYNWTTGAGDHIIVARATDDLGGTALSETVTLSILSLDNNALPTVSVTSPLGGATTVEGNSITLTADAFDSDGTVQAVDFYVDDVFVGRSASAPYAVDWYATEGTRQVSAKATDNKGAFLFSSDVTITVDPLPAQRYYLHSEFVNDARIDIPSASISGWTSNPDARQGYSFDYTVPTYQELSDRVLAGETTWVLAGNSVTRVFIIWDSGASVFKWAGDYNIQVKLDGASVGGRYGSTEITQFGQHVNIEVLMHHASGSVSTLSPIGVMSNFKVNEGAEYYYPLDDGVGATVARNIGTGDDGTYVSVTDDEWEIKDLTHIPVPPPLPEEPPADIAPNPEPSYLATTYGVRASLPAEHLNNQVAHNGATASEHLTDFLVKDSSGKGLVAHPMVMIFPVEKGKFQHAGDFHIKDETGTTIPAAFDVINRHWGSDNSLRHIQATFNATCDPFVAGVAGSGQITYSLHSGLDEVEPSRGVDITEDASTINIQNTLVSLAITKSPFSVVTPAGNLTTRYVDEALSTINSFSRGDVTIEIEENSKMRCVVKASAPAICNSPTDITHGWAIRFYVCAGSDNIKIDFQLQNSPLNVNRGAPMYFDALDLVVDAAGATEDATLQATETVFADINKAKAGSLSTPTVNLFAKDLYHSAPQGIRTSADGSAAFEMFPEWGEAPIHGEVTTHPHYWLDDLRHCMKEFVLDFSGNTNWYHVEMEAQHLQFPPVCVIPQEYYQLTSVTQKLSGNVPVEPFPEETSRTLIIGSAQCGMDLFFYGDDAGRKQYTANGGGAPYMYTRFYVSGDPKDFYTSELMSRIEWNLRSQCLGDYNYNEMYTALRPNTAPYVGKTWRIFEGSSVDETIRPYEGLTIQAGTPRDDQHAWFYHVETNYYLSGNKWARDWLRSMGEFRKGFLANTDTHISTSTRGVAHPLGVCLSSYRVTGDAQLGTMMTDWVTNVHYARRLAPHNIVGTGTDYTEGVGVFQAAFLCTNLIGVYDDVGDPNGHVMEMITNYTEWNHNYANFGYYHSSTAVTQDESHGNGSYFMDIAAWYSLHTGDPKYFERAELYRSSGLNGGTTPYGIWGIWEGQYEAQMYRYYEQVVLGRT